MSGEGLAPRFGQLHMLQRQRRLGAGTHAPFAEDGGYVGLDGGLGDIQLVGDLLVEQTVTDHAQYPELLGRQAGQLGADGLLLGAERGHRLIYLGGPADIAVEYILYRLLDSLEARGFGNEAAGAEV